MLNLLNESMDSKFVTKTWNIVNANSKSNYDAEVLKYYLCDYNVAYILVRGDIIFRAASATQVVSKDCAPFTKRITNIDETTIDAEDLDSLIPMYNLVKYIVQIILKQQEVYSFIQKMKQLTLMQILLMIITLSLLNISLNY